MAIVESGSTLPIAFNTVGTSRCVTAAISTGTTSLRPPGVLCEDLSPRKRHRKINTSTSTSTLTICTIRARVLLRRCGLIWGPPAASGSADAACPAGVLGNSLETCSSITHLSDHEQLPLLLLAVKSKASGLRCSGSITQGFCPIIAYITTTSQRGWLRESAGRSRNARLILTFSS